MRSEADPARLFFALNPPASVRSELLRRQRQLKLAARPVAAKNLHVTLAFLGEVPVARVPELIAMGSEEPLPRCVLELDQMGVFEQARVAWLGPTRAPPSLQAFRQRLVERLREGGFKRDRRHWLPHVSLYRDLRMPCRKMAVEPLCWRVESFSLVQSRLRQTGPVYSVLQRWRARD